MMERRGCKGKGGEEEKDKEEMGMREDVGGEGWKGSK